MKWLGLAGLICLVITGFSTPAAAQDVKKVEVAGGWNYMAIKDNSDEDWVHFSKGWFAEVAGNLNSTWSVVGLVSGATKTITDFEGSIDITTYPYAFGIRASSRKNPKATPFAHFLVGATNIKAEQGSFSASDTLFTWIVGGGANVRINDAVSARVGGDYIRIKGKDQSEIIQDALQGLRISAGISVGFGG
jgi:opacity protein-like surface antigen